MISLGATVLRGTKQMQNTKLWESQPEGVEEMSGGLPVQVEGAEAEEDPVVLEGSRDSPVGRLQVGAGRELAADLHRGAGNCWAQVQENRLPEANVLKNPFKLLAYNTTIGKKRQ